MDRVSSATSADRALLDAVGPKPSGDQIEVLIGLGMKQYKSGFFNECLETLEVVYKADAYRSNLLILMGAAHFQLRNFPESIFYNQQCIRVDPDCSEAYSNIGNALKELNDVTGAVQFYLKAIKLSPRNADAYNNLAAAQMQLGSERDVEEAMESFRMAILLNPDLVEAHTNLGNLHKTRGEWEDAKRSYSEAIRIKPDFPVGWNNLANILLEEGELTQAIDYFRESIRLNPNLADTHSNLGNALKRLGRFEDAMECYREAIHIAPDFSLAYANMGSCLLDMDRIEEGVRNLRFALQLEPNFPDAFNNLGNALKSLGDVNEAISCYRSCLRLKPDHPHAYNNLGTAMRELGMMKEALHCFSTAIRLMPSFAVAHSNLGSILKDMGRFEQALAHFMEATKLDQSFPLPHCNMGNVLKDMGRSEEAIGCYLQALELDPDFYEAYSNLGSIYKDNGHLGDAIVCYQKALAIQPDCLPAFVNLVHAKTCICDWDGYEEDVERLVTAVEEDMVDLDRVPPLQPFYTLFLPVSAPFARQVAEKHSERVVLNSSVYDLPPYKFQSSLFPGEPLRVGYVSSDFGNHPLSHLMQSVFRFHNRAEFKVYCYALSPSDKSLWRRKIERDADVFRDVHEWKPDDIVKRIVNDQVHILVNLNGFTKGARNEVFALRPAPIQVSYLGYCGTMGADFIDYIVGDDVAIPPHLGPHMSESVVRLPHSYFVTDHKQSARYVLDPINRPSRSTYGVPEDSFVFANFSQLYKFSPHLFDAWAKILQSVSGSIMWLLRFPPDGEENVRKELEARGVPKDQVLFTDVCAKEEHILRCFLVDLFLDAFNCGSHTTACDQLWSGTPTLTLLGEKMSERASSSIVKASCLPDTLICSSVEEYENKAIELSTQPEELLSMRAILEDGRESCPLFDTEMWVRHWEEGLRRMWRLYEQDAPFEDITVPSEADEERQEDEEKDTGNA